MYHLRGGCVPPHSERAEPSYFENSIGYERTTVTDDFTPEADSKCIPGFEFLNEKLQKLQQLRSAIPHAGNFSSSDEISKLIMELDNTTIDVEKMIQEWNENSTLKSEYGEIDADDKEINDWRNTLESMSFVADWQETNVTVDVSPKQVEFWTAVLDGDAETTESLGRESSVNVNLGDPKHWARGTALHRAAMAGFVDVVEVLLNLGASANLIDRYGETALHYASREHDLAVLELLFRSGSIATSQNHFGQSLLHVALDWDPFPAIPCNFSEQVSVPERRELLAATVRMLLAHGADPNTVDKAGLSGLHYAARRNHAAAAALLVESGADPNPVSPEGLTPLDVAWVTPSEAVAEVLRRAGGCAWCNNSEAATKEAFPTEPETQLAEHWAAMEVRPSAR